MGNTQYAKSKTKQSPHSFMNSVLFPQWEIQLQERSKYNKTFTEPSPRRWPLFVLSFLPPKLPADGVLHVYDCETLKATKGETTMGNSSSSIPVPLTADPHEPSCSPVTVTSKPLPPAGWFPPGREPAPPNTHALNGCLLLRGMVKFLHFNKDLYLQLWMKRGHVLT